MNYGIIGNRTTNLVFSLGALYFSRPFLIRVLELDPASNPLNYREQRGDSIQIFFPVQDFEPNKLCSAYKALEFYRYRMIIKNRKKCRC